jgi:hypothetical protein
MEVAHRNFIMYAVLRQIKIEKKTIAHDSEINAPDTVTCIYIYIYPSGLLHAPMQPTRSRGTLDTALVPTITCRLNYYVRTINPGING